MTTSHRPLCPDCPTRRPGEKPLRVILAADGTLRERCGVCAVLRRAEELRDNVRPAAT